MIRLGFLLTSLCLIGVQLAIAQSTEPVVGLRRNPPQVTALTNAKVVSRPGQTIDTAVVVIDGHQIIAVGKDVEVPAGAKVIDCQGKTLYPGLVDAYREIAVDWDNDVAGSYWNANVTPRRNAATALDAADSDLKDYREQGITVQLIAPRDRIIKGRGSVMLTSNSAGSLRPLADPNWQHMQLTVPRNRTSGESYPNSPMGATALVRQALYDAAWYEAAWNAAQANRQLPRPETNLDLAALFQSTRQNTFVIDAPNERMAIRACDLADEFSLKAVLRGSGREYRAIEEIASRKRPVLLPVDFPDAPRVNSAVGAAEVNLQTMMHWYFAPRNAAMVDDAGIEFCFITADLDKPSDFLANVRKTVQHGLPADQALTALTTTPAALLGIDDQVGSIEPGKLANLLVTDGDLFDDETKILQTFVAGEAFDIQSHRRTDDDPLVGTWDLTVEMEGGKVRLALNVKADGDKLKAKLSRPETPQTETAESKSGESVETEGEDEKKETLELRKLLRERQRISALVDFAPLGRLIEQELPSGVGSLELVTVKSTARGKSGYAKVDVFGKLISPGGETFGIKLAKQSSKRDKDESRSDKDSDKNKDDDSHEQDDSSSPSIAVNFPLGGYGRLAAPEQPKHVLLREATVWTCGPEGTIVADVLIRAGKIAKVGEKISAPKGCEIVSAKGKHITPGLIDCHSHMGTDGGVNESGQAVTAEVRISDFIDNSDITIYRQLAGGLTTSSILHGSANPIGGQNQVIKLRWGASMKELKFEGAPAGIKFALGENVKRSQSRYPNTRMGVEQIIRDQFLAAREYEANKRRYAAGDRSLLPPRHDLQLEALAEVQKGKRWVHCHSYRQDEIVATLDVLDEFGIQIGTLQHILEGYKVADRMAKHGAMASAFSDWWAYKFEVFDAIPYNGVLMHDAGLVVSYNSDDRELGRRLNTEAAKAVKYGGVPAEEALKFVTINPAKQLRIDDRVGSVEVGKDADLVIWSGPPLSTTTRCEQTWIDGRKYFDLQSDRETRNRDQQTRRQLIQLIRSQDAPQSESETPDESSQNHRQEWKQAEEDRWLRYDEFCTVRGQ